MPPIVRRFIKTSIIFLVIGLFVGLYMLIRREMEGVWPGPYLVSAHTHAVFIGFVMFMILGVALWLFPKPLPNDRRYNISLVVLVYWLLLIGTLVRIVSEILRAHSSQPELAWLILVAGAVQALGLLIYVWTMWHRIRPSARVLRASISTNAE